MKKDAIIISPIIGSMHSHSDMHESHYLILWIRSRINRLEIDNQSLEDVTSAIFFISPNTHWNINTDATSNISGYALYLSRETMNHPLLRNLHINEIRLFSNGKIPKINLAPGIEKRTHALLEMLDELAGSHLNHKEEAIISLLNAFFVYCDGQCNIKSGMTENSSKKTLVYNFKKLIDQHIEQFQKVDDYARLLSISPSYLNEAVQDTLSVNAKALIDEQLLMRARYDIKFSDKTMKEISFSLGFSSPDYFSYFFKKHTGLTPSSLRSL
jgi:AraC-like DNA-binding protein